MFRSRRNRRFEVLTREPAREPNPGSAVPHVRVLDATDEPTGEASVDPAPSGPERPPEDLRPPPFQIRAVPIDETLRAR
jgi:hypothetical protein